MEADRAATAVGAEVVDAIFVPDYSTFLGFFGEGLHHGGQGWFAQPQSYHNNWQLVEGETATFDEENL